MKMTNRIRIQTALEIAERANRSMQGWLDDATDEEIVNSLSDRGDGAEHDIDIATSWCIEQLWIPDFWEGIEEDEQQVILDMATAIHRSALVEIGKLMEVI